MGTIRASDAASWRSVVEALRDLGEERGPILDDADHDVAVAAAAEAPEAAERADQQAALPLERGRDDVPAPQPRGAGPILVGERDHRPVNRGGRRSIAARTPSRASSV